MGNSESRVRFQAAVLALQDRDVGHGEHAFWEELWRLPKDAEEVFGFVTPDAIQTLKKSHRGNLETLIRQAVSQMEHVARHPKQEYFGQALNCVRVLTRIMPFLLSDGEEEGSFVHELFWTVPEHRTVPLADATRPASGEGGAEGDPQEGETAGATQAAAEETKGGDPSQEEGKGESRSTPPASRDPLGRRLVHAVFQLLFLPGLSAEGRAAEFLRRGLGEDGTAPRRPMTTAEEAVAAGNRDPEIRMLAEAADNMPKREIVWYPGVAFHVVHEPFVSSTTKSARSEVLRLLLVLLSSSMYSPPDERVHVRDRWTEEATSPHCPFIGALFVSLINYPLAYDPVGWGVPYGSLMVNDYDEELTVTSLHVLLALLGFRSSPDQSVHAPAHAPREDAKEGEAGEAGKQKDEKEQKDAGAAGRNGDDPDQVGEGSAILDAVREGSGTINFPRYMLRKMTRPSDYAYVFQKFASLLKNVYEASSSYLPGSMKRLRFEQELLMVLWKLLDENPGFRDYVLRVQDVNKLVTPMLYLMYEGKDDPAKVGLIHMCTFILLLLSGERNFGVALNQPYTESLPVDLPRFSGTHGDLLFIVLHKLFVSGASRLSTLYSCFLTIMANVSPYIKSLGMVTAVKLVNLCEAFSSPRFLYSAPNHPQYIAFLLEILNNFIQYQYEGNTHLVYAIVRRKEVFYRLSSLPMPEERAPQQASEGGGEGHVTPTAAASAAVEGDERGGEVAQAEGTEDKVGDQSKGEGEGEGEDAPAPAASKAISAHTRGTDPVADARRARSAGEEGTEVEAGAAVEGSSAPAAAAATAPAPPSFVPTAAWVRDWQDRLPLYTMTRLLQFLAPQVEALCTREDGASTREDEVIDFLKSTTMVGLLPVPHPIVVRRYNPNQYTNLWFTTFLWGVVFLQHQNLPVFDADRIRLFTINRSGPAE